MNIDIKKKFIKKVPKLSVIKYTDLHKTVYHSISYIFLNMTI